MKRNLTFLVVLSMMFSEPPREIPEDLYDKYTFNREIPVKSWYLDHTKYTQRTYTKEEVSRLMKRVRNREMNYYHMTDTWLYSALDKYLDLIKGKKVAIMGSEEPWYEAVILEYGGYPVTIEYNRILTDDPRLTIMTVDEYRKNPVKFDVILSISSFEHDGLGRYGDPIDPDGDLRAMKETKDMLNPGGVLFLAVPIGKDTLFWNAHRVYGERRFPLLIDGWNVLDSFGFTATDFQRGGRGSHQPVFALSPE